MKTWVKIGVVSSLIGWAVSAAHTDSIQPIVNTSQVLYGSAQRTITSNSAVQIDTTTHVLKATAGIQTPQITFPDHTVITTSSTLGGNPPWGTIIGTLSNQTDLQNALTGIAVSTASLAVSVVGVQSALSALGTSVATSTTALQTQIYAVGVTTGNLQTSVNVVAGTTANLSTSVAALNLSTASLKTQINAVASDTGTIQTQVNAIVVSTAALAVSTASLQSQINGLGTTYLTQSSATATYLQTSNAAATYLQQSSATATYLQLSSATATYAQNNIYASGTSTGILKAQDWNTFNSKSPTFPATALAVTTGTLSGFASVQSSPTAVINFEQAQFKVSPAGSATAYVSLDPSSATLLGNNFNIANKLVQLTAGGQFPALDGNLITNVNPGNISGVIKIQNTLQTGSTFYVSSGTVQGPLTVYGTLNANGSSGMNATYGVRTGSVTFNDGTVLISTASFGNGAFIGNQNALQPGSTFYVSSGTVEGPLIVHTFQEIGGGYNWWTNPSPSSILFTSLVPTNITSHSSNHQKDTVAGWNFEDGSGNVRLIIPMVGALNSLILNTTGAITLYDGKTNNFVNIQSSTTNTNSHNMVLPVAAAVSTGSFVNVSTINGNTEQLNFFDLYDSSPNWSGTHTFSLPIQQHDANENVGIGDAPLFRITSGNFNTAVGAVALANVTDGFSNTAMGFESSIDFDGINSVSIGAYSSTATATGFSLTSIGYASGPQVEGLFNSTAIGANAIVTSSNTMRLGGFGTNAELVSMSSATVTGYYRLASKTIAQLHALVPFTTLEEYGCSDCTVDSVAISTGTGVGAFGEAGSKTTFPH